jgi:O-antigen/teichoic acid export membrane protein
MSIIKRLLGHTSIYAFADVILMAGGLISFPIITRLLTKEEYGTMVLISITIGMITSLAGLGLNHSTLRFHSEYGGTKEFRKFYSTLIISSFASGLAFTVFSLVSIKFLSIFHTISFDLFKFFSLASFLIIIRVMFDITGCICRASEQPWIFSFFAILTKYFALGLIILFLSIFSLGLFGYYFGLAIGELTVLVAFWFFFIRQIGFSFKQFSLPILRKMTAYGFPLVMSGFAALILLSSDRYLIGYFLTKADVAIYSVACSLSSYTTGILLGGFQFGFLPLIMKEWNRGAREETHLEIQRVIRLYFMVALPLVAGLCIVGQQIIVMLASEKYAQAFYVLPYVAIASMLNGLFGPLTLGFLFYEQTGKIAILMAQAAILNVLMNLVLIPSIGLYGAAISTLFCYLLLLIVSSIKSSKYFRIKIPWHPILLYVICILLMYFTLKGFIALYPRSHLFTQIGIGTLSYVSFLFVLDKKLRRVTILQIHRFVEGKLRQSSQ